MPSPVDSAYTLANAGRAAEASALLETAAARGDADAWVELAVWHLEGRIIPRDLGQARECFRHAGEAGHPRSRMIHLSFVASGTGGASDWPAAMELLRELARTDRDAARQVELIDRMQLTESGDPPSAPPPMQLGDRPRAVCFPAMLSAEECAYLVEIATPQFQPAVVVDPRNGQMVPNPVRTSEGAGFPLVAETPFVHALNRRMAAASGTDVASGEPLQVLRYRPGQEYRPHFDALRATDNQRILTMLIYLNAGYGGGQTKFLSSGLSFKGEPGDALLFWNADEKGNPDPDAQHAGLPVTSGEKLLASRWIRQRRFMPV